MTPSARLRHSKTLQKKAPSLQYCRELCGTLASTTFYEEDGSDIHFSKEEAAIIVMAIRGSKWGQTKEWFIDNSAAQPSDEVLLDLMELGWSNSPLRKKEEVETEAEEVQEEDVIRFD